MHSVLLMHLVFTLTLLIRITVILVQQNISVHELTSLTPALLNSLETRPTLLYAWYLEYVFPYRINTNFDVVPSPLQPTHISDLTLLVLQIWASKPILEMGFHFVFYLNRFYSEDVGKTKVLIVIKMPSYYPPEMPRTDKFFIIYYPRIRVAQPNSVVRIVKCCPRNPSSTQWWIQQQSAHSNFKFGFSVYLLAWLTQAARPLC